MSGLEGPQCTRHGTTVITADTKRGYYGHAIEEKPSEAVRTYEGMDVGGTEVLFK